MSETTLDQKFEQSLCRCLGRWSRECSPLLPQGAHGQIGNHNWIEHYPKQNWVPDTNSETVVDTSAKAVPVHGVRPHHDHGLRREENLLYRPSAEPPGGTGEMENASVVLETVKVGAFDAFRA